MPKFLKHLLILSLYGLIVLIIIGHSPSELADNFVGSDTGDSYEMARNVWWFGFALRNGEPLLHQTYLGYPDGIDGSVFLSLPMQYFPMATLALFLPLPIVYHVIVVLWMALNGWSMAWLARYLLKKANFAQIEIPAFLSGLVYMAFPLFQAHLAEGHAGLIVAWAAPLYLWSLFEYIEARNKVWRWFWLTVLFFYLSTTGHILQSIYVLMPVTGVFALGKIWQRDWQAIRRIFIMGFVASLLVGLVLFPAIRSATSESAYVDTQGYVRYSADLLAYLSPSFFHPFFDSFLSYPRQVLGTNLAEGAAYIGILATSLVILGLLKQKQSRWWLLLAGVAWIFSLGSVLKIFDQSTGIPLPFALLQNLPAFNLARTPARFNFTFVIAFAALFAYGMAWLWNRYSSQWKYLLALALTIGILWEYQSFWAMPLQTASIPQAVIDLREEEGVRAVFDIPYENPLAAKDGLFLQTGHHLPLLAGQITRTSPVNPAMLAMLQSSLDPQLLQGRAVDIVILHRWRAGSDAEILENRANEQLRAAIYQDERIAIYRVPSVENPIHFDYEVTEYDIAFENGSNLVAAQPFYWQNQAYLWMQWYFEESIPDSDVRFVHIVDEAGEIVLQNDAPFGGIPAGEQSSQLLPFDLSDLEAGTYFIRIGVYDFNSLTNYRTAENSEFIIIGEFELP